MALDWSVKVEYVFEQCEAVVGQSWVKDYADECPAYDPHREYRVFWSPVDGDSPELMLERVSEIPVLTEEQERKSEPGYWRACILGVQDDPKKFEKCQTRKDVNWGKGGSRNIKKSKGNNKSQETASKTVQNKLRSTRSNLLGRPERSEAFKDLDRELGTFHDSSDDSVDDPTLVSDAQLKVLETSVKNLRKKLLEKSTEVEVLEKKLSEKDAELDKLRQLNMSLQEMVLDKVRNVFSSPCSSLPSSRSSSISSLNSLFEYRSRSPQCGSRTRSDSTSSSIGTLSYKRKTPPGSPVLTVSAQRNSPPAKRSNNTIMDTNSQLPSPIKPRSSLDSSSATLVNSPNDSVSLSNASADQQPQEQENQEHREHMVEFVPGVFVDERKLKKVEERPLGKSDDGTYVKELAVVVFGMKVLYNSSLKERKYTSKPSDLGEEERTPRKTLNPDVLKEIAKRVALRVSREFDGKVPIDQQSRYQLATTNRMIYEKIKKMRKNKTLDFLDDNYQGPVDATTTAT